MESDAISEIESKARELKVNGKVRAALVLRKQLELNLHESGAPTARQAINLNWISYLATCAGDLDDAERAARKTVLLYRPLATDPDEKLATYLMMLSCILAERQQFDEAVAHGEEAIEIFKKRHGDTSQFVKDRENAVTRMRAKEIRNYVER